MQTDCLVTLFWFGASVVLFKIRKIKEYIKMVSYVKNSLFALFHNLFSLGYKVESSVRGSGKCHKLGNFLFLESHLCVSSCWTM